MAKVKENSPFTCRFLNEDHFAELHKTFLAAFCDYMVPFQLSVDQLHKHILNNAIDLDLSVGCFAPEEAEDETKMIGFTLNGFGMWGGRSTAYDAGTGVIPEFRRRGASRAMFEFMIPVLRGRGIEQLLLEVMIANEKAVDLYRGLRFEQTRKLYVLKAERPLHPAKIARDLSANIAGITVKELSRLDWKHFQTFWDGEPSWQNSPEAVERTRDIRIILGAFAGDKCVGYVIFSDVGNIVQLAVDKNHRNRGVGSLLLSRMQERVKADKPLQVTNLDEALTEAHRFLSNRGFAENMNQYEMIKSL